MAWLMTDDLSQFPLSGHVLFSQQLHCQIRVNSNNTTVISYINKFSGCRINKARSALSWLFSVHGKLSVFIRLLVDL